MHARMHFTTSTFHALQENRGRSSPKAKETGDDKKTTRTTHTLDTKTPKNNADMEYFELTNVINIRHPKSDAPMLARTNG